MYQLYVFAAVFVYLNLSPAVGCGSAIPDITDIKYDLPVCHEVYDGHIYIYIYKLTERIVVLLNAILKSEI